MFKSILVLESTWESDAMRSISVWPFVSEFARSVEINAYHKHFSDRNSFLHWVDVFNAADTREPKLLYIAAHGSSNKLAALKREINCRTVIQALAVSKNIRYVHFGSCLFGNEDNLDSFLEQADHLRWVAGYENSIDWVESTLFDVMFWRRVGIRDDDEKGTRTHTLADSFINDTKGVVQRLGFRFHCRYRGEIYNVFPE